MLFVNATTPVHEANNAQLSQHYTMGNELSHHGPVHFNGYTAVCERTMGRETFRRHVGRGANSLVIHVDTVRRRHRTLARTLHVNTNDCTGLKGSQL